MINAQVDKPGGTGTASAITQEGRLLQRSGADTVAQCSADTDVAVGVSATSAAANADVRCYLPWQIARLQSNGNLDPANAAHVFLTSDAAGQGIVAASGDRVMALWLRQPGEDPAANDFITVLVTDQATILA